MLYNQFLMTFMITIFLNIDGDCGRGFSRIKDLCVNVSITTVAKDDIPAKCGELGTNIEPLLSLIHI